MEYCGGALPGFCAGDRSGKCLAMRTSGAKTGGLAEACRISEVKAVPGCAIEIVLLIIHCALRPGSMRNTEWFRAAGGICRRKKRRNMENDMGPGCRGLG